MPASAAVTESHRTIAPVWHTVIVLFALIGLALAVARSQTLPLVGAFGKGAGYVWIVLFEWASRFRTRDSADTSGSVGVARS